MRILVAYVTRSGYTRLVATAIANRLRAHGHAVDVADLEVTIRRPKDYDVIVLGSAIRYGKHAPVVATWIADHHWELTLKPCAFFSVDHSAYASPRVDPEGHMEQLFRRLDWHPRHRAAFAGLVMKAESGRRGTPTDTSRDHVLTDWDRVTAFADEIATDASGLTPPPPAGRAARQVQRPPP